jgi:hypothetical protein
MFRRLCSCDIFFTTKAFPAGLRWSRKPSQGKAFALSIPADTLTKPESVDESVGDRRVNEENAF